MNAIISFGLVPQTMDEAMRLAEMMSTAKLVPQALQKSPADCLMVIQQAIRWRMDPFAVAQEVSVVQGKLMYSGKMVAAVVNTRGNLDGRLSFEYRGDGEGRSIVVSGKFFDERLPRLVVVTLANAKTQNTQWQKQPDQQLMYHGVRVWARRHAPELMLGVYSSEEFDDEVIRPRFAPNIMRQPDLPAIESPHDPQTGEIDDDLQGSDGAGDIRLASEPSENNIVPSNDEAGEEFIEDQEIAEKVALCKNIKALENYFRSLSPDEQTRFKPLFTARKEKM